MELIVKVTGKCNFACDFCLAGKADIKHHEHPSENLKKQLEILRPTSLIMNGGEPLLVGRQYFEELLEIYDGEIAIVSNLKDFDARPEYWKPLFLNPRISVVTSFQYGARRRWSVGQPYTEEKFKHVIDKFKTVIGYSPMFISVISNENEEFALKHVFLAKELGTVCKLNPMLPLGICNEFYPIYKMIDIWLKIKDLGLEQYTDANVQFYSGGCAFNTSLRCENTIRVIFEDADGNVKYSNCESKAMQQQFIDVDIECPKSNQTMINPRKLISSACISCELCRICNGCEIQREIAKTDPDHCVEMLKRKQRILASGWYL